MSYVSHLECSRTQTEYPAGELYNLSPGHGAPMFVRYRLDEIRKVISPKDFPRRSQSMWRYLEVLPISSENEAVTLGEGYTPLLKLAKLGSRYDLENLFVKDEGTNPTGSFKDRGLSAAVTMAMTLGVDKLCIPTAGNAGGSLAAYAAHAGLDAFVFMPEDTPSSNQIETQLFGAQVSKVDGLISDAARLMGEAQEKHGWFDVSTLKEPYRIEGKKTMGYELAEQLGWSLPDVILYPTGGGTGLIGMCKAFEEMEQLGWIGSKRPRMVAVQAKGCAPIVKAFEKGSEDSEFWQGANTFAAGIRVPKALGDFLILRDLRESEGKAIAVSDDQILKALKEVASEEGLFICPEGAACWAALKVLREQGWVREKEQVVLFNTASGYKYLDHLPGGH
jgi:threonine synthase